MTGSTMYAQILHEWGGELRYEAVPRPACGRQEALVKVEACGVGLTVLNYMRGNHSQTPRGPSPDSRSRGGRNSR